LKERKGTDLENRLVRFSLMIIDIVEQLPNTRVGNHISGQLIRCGTAPAFNYGEAQSAESKNDFVHKMKICLKELRETLVCLKIIFNRPLINPAEKVSPVIRETNELISIFVTSINTANQKHK
jgi:four helix bundle protein